MKPVRIEKKSDINIQDDFLHFRKMRQSGEVCQWLLVPVSDPDTLIMIRNSGLNIVSSDRDPDPEPNPHVFGPLAIRVP
jgi:hypothetical protein